MADQIYINGRFTAQNLSGVQRFATEMTSALLAQYPGRATLLAPPNAGPSAGAARKVGRRTGQIWEQAELPKFARDGILLNFGNTAPLMARRQLVVIHDAGIFRTPEAYSSRFRLWYRLLHTRLARSGARIVTISQFSRRELADTLKLGPERIDVIPEGADHMHRITAEPAVLARHGLEPQKYVLAVGTLAAHKNLAALGMLSDLLAQRGMVLAVTGAFGGQAFAGANGRRLPASARYLGRVSDGELKALYMQAGCFVFPSLYEGFGLPAVEAMACGCPVVAADIPALRESCGSGAVFCDPRSEAQIAGAVLQLLDNPELQMRLRQEAGAHVARIVWARAAQHLGVIVRSLEQDYEPMPAHAEPPAQKFSGQAGL